MGGPGEAQQVADQGSVPLLICSDMTGPEGVTLAGSEPFPSGTDLPAEKRDLFLCPTKLLDIAKKTYHIVAASPVVDSTRRVIFAEVGAVVKGLLDGVQVEEVESDFTWPAAVVATSGLTCVGNSPDKTQSPNQHYAACIDPDGRVMAFQEKLPMLTVPCSIDNPAVTGFMEFNFSQASTDFVLGVGKHFPNAMCGSWLPSQKRWEFKVNAGNEIAIEKLGGYFDIYSWDGVIGSVDDSVKTEIRNGTLATATDADREAAHDAVDHIIWQFWFGKFSSWAQTLVALSTLATAVGGILMNRRRRGERDDDDQKPKPPTPPPAPRRAPKPAPRPAPRKPDPVVEVEPDPVRVRFLEPGTPIVIDGVEVYRVGDPLEIPKVVEVEAPKVDKVPEAPPVGEPLPWYSRAGDFVSNNARGIAWGAAGVVAGAATVALIADDATGIGAADDPLLVITAPATAGAFQRAAQAFSMAW